MPIRLSTAIAIGRKALLKKIEDYARDLLSDLNRRKADKKEFWYYLEFCSPAIMDLVAWERIHAVDLQDMPCVKSLFVEMTKAAHHSVSNNGSRQPEFSGQGRRTFDEISEAELAANILPRLELILHCWGISYDFLGDKISERQLTEKEASRLTDYHGKY
jgi:hypothetical protein